MITYEYLCSRCGGHVTVKQSIKDEPVKLCPYCDQQSLEKILFASPFSLKGDGWYKTDFKDK